MMPTVPLYPRRAAGGGRCLLPVAAAALSCLMPTVLEWADSDQRVHSAQMVSPTVLLSLACRQQGDRGEAAATSVMAGPSAPLEGLSTLLAALFAVTLELNWMV